FMSQTPFKQLLKRLHVAHLESDYAREALLSWYRLLHGGKLASVSFADFCHRTGLRLEDREEGGLIQNLPPIQRWLNRILALPIHLQNAIFDEFLGLVEARIDAARKAGTFDAGVETIRADKLTVVEERILRPDPSSPTQLLTIEAQWAAQITSLADIRERMRRAGGKARSMRNGRSGRVALLVPDRTWLDEEGKALPTYRLYRPNGHTTITEAELAESHWDDCSLEAFEALWEQEAEEAAQRPHVERLFLATGRLLPIWNLLGDEAQVRRLVTQDGRSLLGRIVPADSVNHLLTKLGLDDRIAMAPDELVGAAMSGKIVPIDAVRGLNLKRSRVNGEQRLEITGFEARSLPHWKARGCFTEIIQYQTRLFVPVSRAVEIVEAIAA
ncbi:strawberry notch C-terminal domain-containing protein, partial [uncultured Novosphingobium sp.]|uniref:strawberry notch C-terminal domain-containing protein n=2 Tax=Novosphingobium TaxID=165696 RepID=UPI00262F94EA